MKTPSNLHSCAPAFLVALLAALAGCGGGGGNKGLCPVPSADGPTVLFNAFVPNTEELAPFPTDLKTKPDGTSPTGLRPDYSRTIFASALDTLSGFGLYAATFAPTSAPVDAATLPATPEQSTAAGASVFLLDLTDLGAGGRTLDQRKVPVEVAASGNSSGLFLHGSTRNALGAKPVHPLATNTRYGFVVTSCATAGGKPLGPAPRFTELLDGTPPAGANQDGVEDTAELVAYLEASGYARDDIALATTFTTQNVTADFVRGREKIYEGAPPAPAITAVYEGTDGSGSLNPDLLARLPGVVERLADFPLDQYRFGRIGKVAFGTFPARDFVGDDDLFSRDADGALAPAGDLQLEFVVVLPKEDAAGGIAPPYNVLVYQHPMGLCKETALVIGDTMARYGIALVGIDAAVHGSRSAGGQGSCDTDPMEFFSVDNLARSADRFRVSALDLMSLVRMLKESGAAIDVLPAPDGDDQPDLGTGRLAFAGMSMGAAIGTAFLAFEKHVGAAVLAVAGGVLSAMMLHTTNGEPGVPMPYTGYDLHGLSLASAFQTVADCADPVDFGAYLVDERLPGFERPLSVLYQQSVGDAAVPLEAYGIIAEMIGMPIAEPVLHDYPALARTATPVEDNVAEGVTAGLFQFDPPAPHEMLLSCEEECMDVVWANQVQMGIFAKTYLEGGSSVIVDPWDEAQVAAHE